MVGGTGLRASSILSPDFLDQHDKPKPSSGKLVE
jgi:hypothetical protein